MCYQTRQIRTVKDLELRYTKSLVSEEIRDLFNKPSYHLNGFAHPNMLVIPQEKSNVLAPAVWGIVPNSKTFNDIKNYYKESVRFGSGLNAQSEKLFNHFIYKHSAFSRRCIIPVTGFFEPHQSIGKKYPIYIHKKDDSVFSLAGIYTVIDKFITFTILTKKANSYFEKIHNVKKRQPVILDHSSEEKWLSDELEEQDISHIINSDVDINQFEAYPVSKDIYRNTVDSNVPSIVSKHDYPELNYSF